MNGDEVIAARSPTDIEAENGGNFSRVLHAENESMRLSR